MMILVGRPVVYRNTLSDLRISAVDGTAFLDACAALVPYADGNHLVEIYDSAGRMLRGFLKAQGGGETVGEELAQPLATNWTDTPAWTEGEGVASCNGGTGFLEQTIPPNTARNVLYKIGFTIDSRDSGSTRLQLYNAPLLLYSTVGAHVAYCIRTAKLKYLGFYGLSFNGQVSTPSLKPVLTPSTDGATIVNAKGGTTYNFAYKDDAFAYNAASYYVIVKKVR